MQLAPLVEAMNGNGFQAVMAKASLKVRGILACRLWDVKTGEKMDKDRFRRDLGNVEETYAEVLKRVKND